MRLTQTAEEIGGEFKLTSFPLGPCDTSRTLRRRRDHSFGIDRYLWSIARALHIWSYC
jgi:hypothetical protein